jgi:hypothetical protein
MAALGVIKRVARGPLLACADGLLARAGLYRAEVNCDIGFFAQLSGVMGVLRICERRGLSPALALTGSLYAEAARGRDFLAYFFEGPQYSARQLRLMTMLPARRERDFTLLPGWSREDYPPLETAGSLFARYYRLRKDITDEVRDFARDCLPPGTALGIHFRGTDKLVTDSTHLGFDQVAVYIRRCLRAYPALDRLFVATDEPAFLMYLNKHFPAQKVVTPPDRVRPSGAGAVHLSVAGGGYDKGRDALVNALLLSECAVLLKTMSNLSGWSSVFRPTLPTILLNRPMGAGIDTLGFPEREMVDRDWFADRLLAEA